MNNNPSHLKRYIAWYEHQIAYAKKQIRRKRSPLNKKYWITSMKLCNVYMENLKYRLEHPDFIEELKLTQSGYLELKVVSTGKLANAIKTV